MALSEQYVIELSGLPYFWGGGISSSPAAFLFLIFLRTESSSSLVNGPSLMSNCLLIILVIGSFVTFDGFPGRFSKCYFQSFTLSCWLAAFNFALAVLFLLLTSFIVCQAILDCLSSTDSLIFCFIIYNYIYIYIYHHHHHAVQPARISLTLSRHFSLSFIASGRSSGLHPVFSHSCCIFGLVVLLLLGHMWGSIGVQCPACLVRLTWIVFGIGGKWPYS